MKHGSGEYIKAPMKTGVRNYCSIVVWNLSPIDSFSSCLSCFSTRENYFPADRTILTRPFALDIFHVAQHIPSV